MSKRARDRRARNRRDERYLSGKPKVDDLDIHLYDWNKSQVRRLRKWQRQRGQLLFQDKVEYLNWLHLGLESPLKKGNK